SGWRRVGSCHSGSGRSNLVAGVTWCSHSRFFNVCGERRDVSPPVLRRTGGLTSRRSPNPRQELACQNHFFPLGAASCCFLPISDWASPVRLCCALDFGACWIRGTPLL